MNRAKNTNDKFKQFEKEDEIKKEIRKYNALFKEMESKVKKSLQSLIQNAAFMAVTLRELQQTLNKDGLITEYQNGENQWGTKKSPEIEIYTTMVKNYISAMKQLTDFLPKDSGQKILDDGFDEFVNNR